MQSLFTYRGCWTLIRFTYYRNQRTTGRKHLSAVCGARLTLHKLPHTDGGARDLLHPSELLAAAEPCRGSWARLPVSAHLLQVGRQLKCRRQELFLFVHHFGLTWPIVVNAWGSNKKQTLITLMWLREGKLLGKEMSLPGYVCMC